MKAIWTTSQKSCDAFCFLREFKFVKIHTRKYKVLIHLLVVVINALFETV